MNNTALITGASSGIGLELAKLHASKKGDLVLVSRSESKIINLKSELERKYAVNVWVFACDLSQANQVDKLYQSIVESNISVDFLMNNAGVTDIKSFEHMKWEYINEMISTNMLALTKLCHLFMPHLKLVEGKILNVASTAAFQPIPLQSVYAATKAYVYSFSYALAEELSKEGVSVTVLCPGPTKTNLIDSKLLKDSFKKNELVMSSAKEVAKQGYSGMLKGKLEVIPGLTNKIGAIASSVIPKVFSTKLSGKLFERALKN